LSTSEVQVALLVWLNPVPNPHSLSYLLLEIDSTSFSVWPHSVPGRGVGLAARLLVMAEGNTGHRDPAVGKTKCLGPATGGSVVCVRSSLANLKLD